MRNILDDIAVAAEWMTKALRSSGYAADMTPESLWQVEFFFEDNCRDGQAVRGGLLSTNLGQRLFGLGAYVGEVLRRSLGGEWHGDDADPQAEINVELRLGQGSRCWPVQRVMKRFRNGPEDSIVAYASGMGSVVGPRPHRVQRKKPWWKVW